MEKLDKIKVNDDFDQRLDIFLADYYEDISRSKLSKMIKNKNILVNGKPQKASYIVQEDDEIIIDLSALDIPDLKAQDLDIDIIYQDEHIAIINKPFGIISHPTNTIRENTVVNFLISKFTNLPSLYGKDRAGIVHRLDKDTSGLMIVALTEQALITLQDMFRNRLILKKYRAIVNGGFSDNSGIIENKISRSTKNRKLMMVSDEGRFAKTSYEVLNKSQDYSYLDIRLHTGRTHQIRVHFAHMSNPILGDQDYNNVKSVYKVDRQLLQAYLLEFNHPITGELLKFEIDPYPEFVKYYNLIFEEDKWTDTQDQ